MQLPHFGDGPGTVLDFAQRRNHFDLALGLGTIADDPFVLIGGGGRDGDINVVNGELLSQLLNAVHAVKNRYAANLGMVLLNVVIHHENGRSPPGPFVEQVVYQRGAGVAAAHYHDPAGNLVLHRGNGSANADIPVNKTGKQKKTNGDNGSHHIDRQGKRHIQNQPIEVIKYHGGNRTHGDPGNVQRGGVNPQHMIDTVGTQAEGREYGKCPKALKIIGEKRGIQDKIIQQQIRKNDCNIDD